MSLDCWCDYEPASFYRAEIKHARKLHKCGECSAMIEPGATYEYVAGMWEGYFDTFKTCQRCCDLRVWVKNNVPCFCWAHGNLIEDATQAIEDARHRAPEETRGLRFGYLRRVASIRKQPHIWEMRQ